jgi:uncharacterized protein YjbI with pentapeptide repeats
MRTRRELCFSAAGALAVAAVGRGDAFAQPRHFRDQDLSNRDFSKQNLTYNDYSRAKFEKSDLSYANCSHSVFKGTDFRGATLKYANFNQSDLSEADLREADTFGASFRDAKLARANLSGLTLYLAGALQLLEEKDDPDESSAVRRARSNIKFALQDVDVRPDRDNGSLSLQGANLRNALIFGNLERVNFRGADLRGADLTKTANLQQAILRGAIYDSDTNWKIDPAALGAVKR